MAVRVTDTGPGLDADAVDRIFEPSFPKKRDGRGHGPDLALANVYAIVQQCEGRIAVTSAPGAPTTFTIAFPRVAPGPIFHGSVNRARAMSPYQGEGFPLDGIVNSMS